MTKGIIQMVTSINHTKMSPVTYELSLGDGRWLSVEETCESRT